MRCCCVITVDWRWRMVEESRSTSDRSPVMLFRSTAGLSGATSDDVLLVGRRVVKILNLLDGFALAVVFAAAIILGPTTIVLFCGSRE